LGLLEVLKPKSQAQQEVVALILRVKIVICFVREGRIGGREKSVGEIKC